MFKEFFFCCRKWDYMIIIDKWIIGTISACDIQLRDLSNVLGLKWTLVALQLMIIFIPAEKELGYIHCWFNTCMLAIKLKLWKYHNRYRKYLPLRIEVEIVNLLLNCDKFNKVLIWLPLLMIL